MNAQGRGGVDMNSGSRYWGAMIQGRVTGGAAGLWRAEWRAEEESI